MGKGGIAPPQSFLKVGAYAGDHTGVESSMDELVVALDVSCLLEPCITCSVCSIVTTLV